MKKQTSNLTPQEVFNRQNLEDSILQCDRHLTYADSCLARNLMENSEEILNEVDTFNDPELSKAMRRTLCRIALA